MNRYVFIVLCIICLGCTKQYAGNRKKTTKKVAVEESGCELRSNFDFVTDSVQKKIKSYEGLALDSYIDGNGKYAIGYGHIQKQQRPQKITKKQADKLFKQDLKVYERFVDSLQICHTQNEFDALVSLVFNIGKSNFLSSKLYDRIQKWEEADSIIHEFRTWRMSDGEVLKGLEERREWEMRLYLWDYFNNNCEL